MHAAGAQLPDEYSSYSALRANSTQCNCRQSKYASTYRRVSLPAQAVNDAITANITERYSSLRDSAPSRGGKRVLDGCQRTFLLAYDKGSLL
jgi:hypothetical protein